MDGADSAVGNYLGNRTAPGEYRDADRTGECEAFRAFAKTNLYRRYLGKKDREVKRYVSHLGK